MIKNTAKLIISFCLSALTFSCSQAKHDEMSEHNNAQEHKTMEDERSELDKRKLLKSKELVKHDNEIVSRGSHTITFNNEKYLYNGKELKKGSQVRGIHMSEIGTIKGTFVVVTHDENLNALFNSKVKIAENTYRLTPIETEDLMTVYHQLLNDKSIVKVELEVMYNGKKEQAATH